MSAYAKATRMIDDFLGVTILWSDYETPGAGRIGIPNDNPSYYGLGARQIQRGGLGRLSFWHPSLPEAYIFHGAFPDSLPLIRVRTAREWAIVGAVDAPPFAPAGSVASTSLEQPEEDFHLLELHAGGEREVCRVLASEVRSRLEAALSEEFLSLDFSHSASFRRALDELLSLWVDRAPGGAYFWAPELLLFGAWYLDMGEDNRPYTRLELDAYLSGCVDAVPRWACAGQLPAFWHADLPEVRVDTYTSEGTRVFTIQPLERRSPNWPWNRVEVDPSSIPFWHHQLPEAAYFPTFGGLHFRPYSQSGPMRWSRVVAVSHA